MSDERPDMDRTQVNPEVEQVHSHSEHAQDGNEMSESEQMYLVTAAMLGEDGMEGPVPLSALAHARNIMPASANQMVRKLADAGLVTYFPYKGIELTPAGQAIATRILRYRRLWEVFLVKKLRMAATAADALACRFEHLTSEDVADRLDHYLGEPAMSPQGKPIPRPNPQEEVNHWVCVSQSGVSQTCRVMQIKGEATIRTFMTNQGLAPGSQLMVSGVGADGSVLLEIEGRMVHLSAALASNLWVLPAEG